MSTDEYAPSEEEMYQAYRRNRPLDHYQDVEAAFDRFLARVRRDAWHEGMLAGDCAAYNGHTTPPNPYEETP